MHTEFSQTFTGKVEISIIFWLAANRFELPFRSHTKHEEIYLLPLYCSECVTVIVWSWSGPTGTGQEWQCKTLFRTLFSVDLLRSFFCSLWNYPELNFETEKEWVGVSHRSLLFYSKQWLCLWELNTNTLFTGHCCTNSNQTSFCNALALNDDNAVKIYCIYRDIFIIGFLHFQLLFAETRRCMSASWLLRECP